MSKKKKIITCHYCLEFQKSKDRKKEMINTRTYYKRYCKFVDKMVHSGMKICEDFIPTRRFWCNKRGYWMDIEVCLKNDLCHRGCKQLKIIKEVSEWKD